MNSTDPYVEAAAWSQIVASVLFMAVLLWLWVKYIQPAIMSSQERANKVIAEAERHRDEAKAALDLLRNEANGAQHDAQLIRQRAEAQSEREREHAIDNAKESGERAVANAEGEFERSLAVARTKLREEMLDKALSLARTELLQRIDANADARLVDQFATSIEKSAPDRFEVARD